MDVVEEIYWLYGGIGLLIVSVLVGVSISRYRNTHKSGKRKKGDCSVK